MVAPTGAQPAPQGWPSREGAMALGWWQLGLLSGRRLNPWEAREPRLKARGGRLGETEQGKERRAPHGRVSELFPRDVG